MKKDGGGGAVCAQTKGTQDTKKLYANLNSVPKLDISVALPTFSKCQSVGFRWVIFSLSAELLRSNVKT